MSELASYHEEKVLEPDEFTLMNALRNQDDIPILMDVVTDKDGVTDDVEDDYSDLDSVSVEAGQGDESLMDDDIPLVNESVEEALIDNDLVDDEDSIPVLTEAEAYDPTSMLADVIESKTTAAIPSPHGISEELIASAISEVLEKRLPELVSDVLRVINERIK